MYNFETNKISKEDFAKINEEDLMFITNPGRMGDEDGSTFIIKHDNVFTIYRVSGWMYRGNKEESVSLDDALKQFPKWEYAWNHNISKDYNGKYKYLYMGFGNGLCVDNSIYDEFEPYLNDLIDEKLKDKTDDEKESLQYTAVFNVWKKAFINMVNDKGYIINK